MYEEKIDLFIFRQEATVTMFAGHIVVSVFADEDSPMLGLRYKLVDRYFCIDKQMCILPLNLIDCRLRFY